MHVVGRVVDVDGLPVAGAAVELAFDGAEVGGACLDAPADARTGPSGDFRVCRHAHALGDGASVTASVAGASATKPLDAVLRHAFVHLRTDAPRSARDVLGDRAFNATVLARVRAYELLATSTVVAGVEVRGGPLAGQSAHARLLVGGSVVAEGNATTDELGDAEVALDARDVPAGARVAVRVGATEADAPVATAHRRADVYVVREEDAPAGPPPGALTPAPSALALVSVLAAAALALGRKG